MIPDPSFPHKYVSAENPGIFFSLYAENPGIFFILYAENPGIYKPVTKIFHFLTLHGSDHNPLLEIFLDKRVYAQHRHGGYNNYRKLDLIRILLGVAALSRPRGSRHGLIGDENVAQYNLQRLVLILIEIKQGRKEVVPVPNRIVQDYNGNYRLGKR